MRTILLSVVVFCVATTSAYARLDLPLKWKLQRWEFVVLVQGGDDVGTTETRHVENDIVTVLRGKKEDLPEFEWWLHREHVKGQYYLMCYHKAPPGTSAWQSFQVEKSQDGFTILTFYTNDGTVFYDDDAEYKDMALGRLQQLLKEVPFEPDVEKTEFYKHGMRSQNGKSPFTPRLRSETDWNWSGKQIQKVLEGYESKRSEFERTFGARSMLRVNEVHCRAKPEHPES